MNTPEVATARTLQLLDRLRAEMPELFTQAQIVGQWVWLEFNMAPDNHVRRRLKALGFHWNSNRRLWQHPCGHSRTRSFDDPRRRYGVRGANDLSLHDDPQKPWSAKEYKVVALRECLLPDAMAICDTPDRAVEYWRQHIETNPYFNPEIECFAVMLLNTRRRVKGHQLLTMGTLDTILVHPREVFRAAIIAAASAIVLMHNHPSGEATPSEADIKVTRDLFRAGQLLRIEVLDHVIIGRPKSVSLRELGYFA